MTVVTKKVKWISRYRSVGVRGGVYLAINEENFTGSRDKEASACPFRRMFRPIHFHWLTANRTIPVIIAPRRFSIGHWNYGTCPIDQTRLSPIKQSFPKKKSWNPDYLPLRTVWPHSKNNGSSLSLTLSLFFFFIKINSTRSPVIGKRRIFTFENRIYCFYDPC